MEYTVKGRSYFVAIVLLLTFQIGLAQTESKIEFDSIKTVLFKITSSNNKHVSYLFGTHHAFGKALFDSLSIANQALATSDILIKENLNILGETAEDIINRRTEITAWNKYLNKVELKYIDKLFAKSPTNYGKMTPTEMYVFLNRHFKQQVCLNRSSNDTSLSLDDYIASKAVEQNLELYGLETTEEQIHLINKDVEGMPRKSHKRRLFNIIEKIRTQNVNDCEEISWYSEMDIDYQTNTPCQNTLILSDRNEKWMRQIKDLIERQNCFIAVGLSHLMFECGLISQLSDIGYIITPLEVK
ncbi:MAG: TraB/GumN family protein [Vicingaceae bacterium]